MKQPHTWLGTYLKLEKRYTLAKLDKFGGVPPFQWRRQW